MVVLMSSWYYEKKDLKRSPSLLDGLDVERESRYRREGARFIINVGTKMGLRYDTMATGVVYFHRFYMFHSFKTFPRYVTACCCLFLAGKVEETPKKCKDIIKIAKSFLGDSQFAQFGDDPKEEVMTLERILLQTIKFDLQVDHPYGHLLKYAKCLKGDKVKLQNMVQMAWTFINDSLCTTLCLQWEPEVIAIALMYLAGKLSKFEVVDWVSRNSRHSHWWDMFIEGMSVELLEDICHQVLDLYSTPNPNTPQDSPPATPPTKSTRKPTSQPPSPVELCASPILTKPKETPVPVGQPIPRLEPGELKRKVSQQTEFRKETAEAKVPRPVPVLEGKAIPTITTTSSNSSPKKALSSQGSDTQPSSPSTPVESTKSTSSDRSTVADVVFHSNIVSMSQPYSQQTASFLPSAKSTPAKAMPPMPIASFPIAPPSAPTPPYVQPANQYFAPAMGNDYTVSQPPPPPQAFPQRYQHPPPAPPPNPPPTMPQYPEPPQYNTMPPSGGSMPPFGSQYPPPPRPLPPPPPQQPPPPPQVIRPLPPPMPPPHLAPPLPHDPYRPHMEPYMDTRRPPEPPLPPQHHPMRPNPYDYDGGGDRRFRGQRDEFEVPYNLHQQPPRHHHQEAPRPPFEYDESYSQPYHGEYDSPGRLMPQAPRPFRMEHRKPLPPHDRMPPQNPGASTGIAPVRITGSNS